MNVDSTALATWSAFVLGLIVFVFAVLSKTMGGVADTQRLFRGMRKAKEDARVADLTEDITYLRGRVDHLVDESERLWRLIHEHRPWDHGAVAIIREYAPNVRINPPPPLLLRSSIAQEAAVAVAAAEAHEAINTIEAKATAPIEPLDTP